MSTFTPTRIIALLLAASLASAAPVAAEDEGYVTYDVQRGDTLYELDQRFLDGRNSLAQLQRVNGVRDPRSLPVDRPLKFPRDLLKFEDVQLRLAGFSGPVRINGQAPQVGTRLEEGQTITTGRNAFVSFQAPSGAKVSLPSNTTARLMRARRYVLGDTLDVDFAILNGRGEASAPKLKRNERFRMRTPTAVTAVRGTEFRVAHDEAQGRSLTEVVEGAVLVAAGGSERPTEAGFGVAATVDGVGQAEQLLPAPQIDDPGAIQTDEELTFAITPAREAAGIRTQIARDAGFIDILSERIITEGPTTFESLENGRYFVRARAISATGLEGNSEVYSFRRKRLGVSASAEQSALEDGFVFQWLPAGEGKTFFAFQLWDESNLGTPLVDETGLSTSGMILTGLASGSYAWRVAAIQAEEEGLLKVWGPTQKLTVSE